MSHYRQPAPEGKDPELWEIAQKRASFKSHLVTYLIVNTFFWGIWFFTDNHHNGLDMDDEKIIFSAWPIWTTLCWGVGLAFHYAGAYITTKKDGVEREYQKLKNQQNK